MSQILMESILLFSPLDGPLFRASTATEKILVSVVWYMGVFMLDEKADEVLEAADAFLERPPKDRESSGVRQKNSSSEDSFLFLLWPAVVPEAAEDFLEIDASPWEELEPSKRRGREEKKFHSVSVCLSAWSGLV